MGSAAGGATRSDTDAASRDLITRAGTPAATTRGGRSRVTTAPAATTHPAPIVTPSTIVAPAPIQQSSPMRTPRRLTPWARIGVVSNS
jgi:hypothetical protein